MQDQTCHTRDPYWLHGQAAVSTREPDLCVLSKSGSDFAQHQVWHLINVHTAVAGEKRHDKIVLVGVEVSPGRWSSVFSCQAAKICS